MRIDSVTPSDMEGYIKRINAGVEGGGEQDLEVSDPDLVLRKTLIERMFTKRKDDRNEDDITIREKTRQKTRTRLKDDSVEISSRAMEKRREQLAAGTQEGTTRILSRSKQWSRMTIELTRESPDPPPQVQSQEPLVLDLDHDGVELTDVIEGKGVTFDITGDGRAEQVSWVSPDDGLLACDANGNGTIDSGRELFGDQNGAANGFEELRKYDTDSNGIIDANDAVFSSLTVWQDSNSDGISLLSELKSLQHYGITQINLAFDPAEETVSNNRIAGYGAYQTEQGEGQIGEVYLNYLA